MKLALQIISYIALAGTILPSILYTAQVIDQDLVKWVMLISTILWFVTSPFWMNTEDQSGL
jgi:hypothetical protein